MGKRSLSLILGASLVTVAQHGAYAEESVNRIIGEAINTNPQVLAEKAKEKAQEYTVDRARSGYYPKFDVRASVGWERNENSFGRTKCNAPQVCKETEFRHDPSAVLRWPIFDGMKTPTDVNRAKAQEFQQVRKVAETQEILSFQLYNAAVDVRRFQRLQRLAIENVKQHENIANKVKSLFNSGKATAADVHTVQSRLLDSRSTVVDIESDLGAAVAKFIETSGIHPDRLSSTEIDPSLLPKTLDEAISTALSNNRSMLLADANVSVSKAEQDAAEVPFYPSLDLQVDGTSSHNTSARRGHNNNFNALAVVRYNLFNGGGDLARMREAALNVSEQKHRLDASRRAAERDVRIAWTSMTSSNEHAKQLRAAVKEKLEVTKVFNEQFDLGTRSLLDLLDSTNEYFLAKGSLITVDATADVAAARLLAAEGVFLNKLGYRNDLQAPKKASSAVMVEAQEVAQNQIESATETMSGAPSVTKEDVQPAMPVIEEANTSSYSQEPIVIARTSSETNYAKQDTNYDELSLGIEISGDVASGAALS